MPAAAPDEWAKGVTADDLRLHGVDIGAGETASQAVMRLAEETCVDLAMVGRCLDLLRSGRCMLSGGTPLAMLSYSPRLGVYRASFDGDCSADLSALTQPSAGVWLALLSGEVGPLALCSGFRESAVRRVFDHVSLCFCDWESAEAIVSAGEICCATAASTFANRLKLRGIFSAAKYINDIGFDEFKRSVLADPINRLQSLPFIGPITSWHLAKNLGLDVAKPDRHLVRVSEHLGFLSADDLCRELAASTGEQAKVVDLIVWRYIADNPEQLRMSFA